MVKYSLIVMICNVLKSYLNFATYSFKLVILICEQEQLYI